MKLSKLSWAILAIGVLAITFGSLGVTNSQRLDEGKKLSDELATAQLRLSKLDLKELYSGQETLETQMKQAEAQLATDQATLAQPNDSIFISDAVFHIARLSGVEVSQTGSATLTRENLDRVSNSVLAFEVVASGDVPSLIDFITRLNVDFPTGKVKLAQIVVPRISDNLTDGLATNNTATAHVQLVIYSYDGK